MIVSKEMGMLEIMLEIVRRNRGTSNTGQYALLCRIVREVSRDADFAQLLETALAMSTEFAPSIEKVERVLTEPTGGIHYLLAREGIADGGSPAACSRRR